MTLNVTRWLVKRKIHDSLYKRARLRDHLGDVNHIADKFLEEMNVYAESGEVFQFGNEMHKFTYNTIIQVVYWLKLVLYAVVRSDKLLGLQQSSLLRTCEISSH